MTSTNAYYCSECEVDFSHLRLAPSALARTWHRHLVSVTHRQRVLAGAWTHHERDRVQEDADICAVHESGAYDDFWNFSMREQFADDSDADADADAHTSCADGSDVVRVFSRFLPEIVDIAESVTPLCLDESNAMTVADHKENCRLTPPLLASELFAQGPVGSSSGPGSKQWLDYDTPAAHAVSESFDKHPEVSQVFAATLLESLSAAGVAVPPTVKGLRTLEAYWNTTGEDTRVLDSQGCEAPQLPVYYYVSSVKGTDFPRLVNEKIPYLRMADALQFLLRLYEAGHYEVKPACVSETTPMRHFRDALGTKLRQKQYSRYIARGDYLAEVILYLDEIKTAHNTKLMVLSIQLANLPYDMQPYLPFVWIETQSGLNDSDACRLFLDEALHFSAWEDQRALESAGLMMVLGRHGRLRRVVGGILKVKGDAPARSSVVNVMSQASDRPIVFESTHKDAFHDLADFLAKFASTHGDIDDDGVVTAADMVAARDASRDHRKFFNQIRTNLDLLAIARNTSTLNDGSDPRHDVSTGQYTQPTLTRIPSLGLWSPALALTRYAGFRALIWWSVMVDVAHLLFHGLTKYVLEILVRLYEHEKDGFNSNVTLALRDIQLFRVQPISYWITQKLKSSDRDFKQNVLRLKFEEVSHMLCVVEIALEPMLAPDDMRLLNVFIDFANSLGNRETTPVIMHNQLRLFSVFYKELIRAVERVNSSSSFMRQKLKRTQEGQTKRAEASINRMQQQQKRDHESSVRTTRSAAGKQERAEKRANTRRENTAKRLSEAGLGDVDSKLAALNEIDSKVREAAQALPGAPRRGAFTLALPNIRNTVWLILNQIFTGPPNGGNATDGETHLRRPKGFSDMTKSLGHTRSAVAGFMKYTRWRRQELWKSAELLDQSSTTAATDSSDEFCSVVLGGARSRFQRSFKGSTDATEVRGVLSFLMHLSPGDEVTHDYFNLLRDANNRIVARLPMFERDNAGTVHRKCGLLCLSLRARSAPPDRTLAVLIDDLVAVSVVGSKTQLGFIVGRKIIWECHDANQVPRRGTVSSERRFFLVSSSASGFSDRCFQVSPRRIPLCREFARCDNLPTSSSASCPSSAASAVATDLFARVVHVFRLEQRHPQLIRYIADPVCEQEPEDTSESEESNSDAI